MESDNLQVVGSNINPIDVTGYLLISNVNDRRPYLLANQEGWFLLPIFSNEQKLRQAVLWMKPDPPWTIGRINHPGEFFKSVYEAQDDILIGADPWVVGEGNVRFTRVLPLVEEI